MPRSTTTLTLSDAKRMLEAGEAKAAGFGVAYNIAVVDAGGALMAFVRRARRAMREDRSGMYWLRLGAASGLVAIAVQGLFEGPLLTPANAALAAVLAAIVVHVPARFGPPPLR